MSCCAKPNKLWGQKTFLLVTGASQGIGQYLALEFSKRLGADSCIILIARSIPGLEETKKNILEANPSVSVIIYSSDLSKPNLEEYANLFKSVNTDVALSIILHNAGSVGDCSKLAADIKDPEEWNNYMALNFFSATALTSEFLNRFRSSECKKVLINITSLTAVKPFKSLTFYCVGKASREMFFKVLALENPELRILNYSPGPIDTSMVQTIVNDANADEVKQMFISMKESNTLVKVEETTAKLLRVLEQDSYKSGARVDFFDDS